MNLILPMSNQTYAKTSELPNNSPTELYPNLIDQHSLKELRRLIIEQSEAIQDLATKINTCERKLDLYEISTQSPSLLHSIMYWLPCFSGGEIKETAVPTDEPNQVTNRESSGLYSHKPITDVVICTSCGSQHITRMKLGFGGTFMFCRYCGSKINNI